MSADLGRPVDIQRQYYTRTAEAYDSMHAGEGATDPNVSRSVLGFLRMLEVRSLLDVGSATGLGLKTIKEALPNAFVCGVEPVIALVQEAVKSGRTLDMPMICASGDALPFPDASFDVVSEFAMLHHVADPAAIVKEMMRVAQRAVFISDANRFGQGPFFLRLIKLLLYKTRLWTLYEFIRTRGKWYQISDGDGLFYSYSVYDSYDLLAEWADRIYVVPTGPTSSRSWFHPLLTSPSVILIALRDPAQPRS